jgi:hypothetical protein
MTRTKTLKWSAFALAVVIVSPCSARAQSRMSRGLQDVKRATCTFPVLAMGRWDAGGVPDVEVKKTLLTLSYDAIDADDGTARLNTRSGDLPIIAKASVWSLHLLQMGGEGTARLTTVFNRENRPGTFKAVHTVHEFTPVGFPNFASLPEQHYGECTVER